MAAVVESDTETEISRNPWRDFVSGSWQDGIDVRNFVQRNYTPYEGDECFLTGATARTNKLWEKLTHLFDEERKKGVLAVSQVPSGILAHGPGYIDKDSEIIVGLQTDAPLKRAIMPFGGWRVVEASLKHYGIEPDPQVAEIFTQVPQDPQRRSFRRLYLGHCEVPALPHHHGAS